MFISEKKLNKHTIELVMSKFENKSFISGFTDFFFAIEYFNDNHNKYIDGDVCVYFFLSTFIDINYKHIDLNDSKKISLIRFLQDMISDVFIKYKIEHIEHNEHTYVMFNFDYGNDYVYNDILEMIFCLEEFLYVNKNKILKFIKNI